MKGAGTGDKRYRKWDVQRLICFSRRRASTCPEGVAQTALCSELTVVWPVSLLIVM